MAEDRSGNYLNPAIANCMAKSALPTQEEREIAMRKAMADVIKHDLHIDPHYGNAAFESRMADEAAAISTPMPNPTPGWREALPLGVAGGEQAQRLIEGMCNAALPTALPVVREISRDEALRLIKELEQTRPDSPVLARAKAALAAEAKDGKGG
jgi:hypothetical protein